MTHVIVDAEGSPVAWGDERLEPATDEQTVERDVPEPPRVEPESPGERVGVYLGRSGDGAPVWAVERSQLSGGSGRGSGGGG
jgi:hypothetical protein